MKASGNPPDVVWHAIGSTYNYLLEDNLVPMTDVISDLDVPDLMRANNESYFLPIVLEPSMAWYRSDYYDQPPTTQQEALNQAEQITENNAINGFITQSGETNNAQVQTIQHLWQNGVDIYDGATGDIEVTIDQGENQQNAVRAFSWLKDISQYSPNANGWEWGDAVNALQTDSAASHMSISLDPLLIQANRPDLLDSLTAAPYPKPQGVNAEKWFAYYEGNVVRSDGSTTEGAKLFAEFFSRSPKTMDFVLSQPLFQVPPTREGLNSDRFQNNDLISQFPEAVEIIDNNWDKWRPSFLTADEAKPNAVAAQSQVERVMGQAAAELLVNDRSPEDTVSWVAETLRGL
jgi:multiple sugar transport system substrate-binding protein